jgi:hypothetical protein
MMKLDDDITEEGVTGDVAPCVVNMQMQRVREVTYKSYNDKGVGQRSRVLPIYSRST